MDLFLFKLLVSTLIINLNYLTINCVFQLDDLTILDNPTTVEEPAILSKSKNFTVHTNATIILPCVIKNLPNTLNTFVIWNQCDDPNCNQLRIPLTVNKDNFVEDLRFRVISDDFKDSSSSSSSLSSSLSSSSNNVITVKRDDKVELIKSSEIAINEKYVNMWNLEIRKFTKSDEGCYQCQLNTYNIKTIHYCLKLQTKILTDTKRMSVKLNDPIKIKCISDENVRLSLIKWYRNGHKLSEDSDSDMVIEKKPPTNDEYLSTSLLIKHASLSDSGIYSCKFGHLTEKIQVDVVVNGDRSIKSSEIRSNSDEYSVDQNGGDSISSSLSNSVNIKSSYLAILLFLIISLLSVLI